MRLALVVVVVACGGKPAPAPVIAHRAAQPAAPTCADVGVILRGSIEHGDDAGEAGRTREAAIANACEIDHWAASVVECIAEKPKPATCLDKLSEEQREAYEAKLAAWNERWGGDSYGGEEGGEEGGVVGGADDAPEIDCEDAAKNASALSPAVKLSGDDVTWDAAMRKHALAELCETDSWTNDTRDCLAKNAAPDTCLAALEADARAHVTKRIDEIDGVAAKLADTRKQAKKITCDKVVAAHYSDARWKDKLDWIKGKDRTKMIGESRDKMKKACSGDKWSDTLRACVTLGGGDACFAAGSVATWGFPAAGVAIATGIPECDAWGQAVTKLVACDKVSQATRDALMQAYTQLAQQAAQMAKDQRAEMGQACLAATEAVKQLGSGCP